MHNLIIQNAYIVDGSGRDGFMGDIAISGGVISNVDRSLRGAHRVLNVDGLAVAPGFIDLHTHSDYSLPRFPRADSMIRQGVTTQVLGNCGFSPFPARPEQRELTRTWSSFFGGDPDWEWPSAASYLDFLGQLPLACNVAIQVGHSALRIAAMGFDDREPTRREIDDMRGLLAQALEDGAFSLTSGLIYPPGSFAKTDELVQLATVLPGYASFYASHIRGEGATLLAAVAEALEIGEKGNVSVHISHHKAQGKAYWGQVDRTLGMVDASRAAGRDVTLDQYPYTAGSTTLTAVLPEWLMHGGIPAMLKALTEPITRQRVSSELFKAGADVSKLNWHGFDVDTIMISWIPEGPNKKYENMLLVDIARTMGKNPADAALELIETERARVQIITFSMVEADVQKVMRHPQVAIASDGWILNPAAGGTPHPRSYGTFVRVLGRYVRELGVLGLEDAVRKMTSLPAARLGRSDLGRIEAGARADVVVFEPGKVIDRATFEDPHQFCEGVRYVIVNGQVVIESGQDTGAAAGQVIRRGRTPAAA